MSARVGICLGFVVAVSFTAASGAFGQDFAEFARLTDQANAMLQQVLEVGDEAEVPELREEAIAAYSGVIDWLEAFFASPAIQDMPEEHVMAARSDRQRWGYNRAVQLLALERCEMARDEMRDLLARPVSDPELRPLLADVHERAVRCVAEQQAASAQAPRRPSQSRANPLAPTCRCSTRPRPRLPLDPHPTGPIGPCGASVRSASGRESTCSLQPRS